VVSKRFELFAYLIAHQFDILAITETFLDSTIHDSHIVPPGYAVFRKDRDRHGGGVMIFVKACINAVRRCDLETNCELLWIELLGKKGSTLLGTFYRPPCSSDSDLQSLSISLNCLLSMNCPIVLCGDFNAPNVDWSTISPTSSSAVANTLCSLVADNFFTQAVTFPTRGNNVLDLIFTNIPEALSYVHLIDNINGTDHEAVSFIISVPNASSYQPSRYLYNYKRADFDHLKSVLSHTPWDMIITSKVFVPLHSCLVQD